jgi:shikimate dehydrogenase
MSEDGVGIEGEKVLVLGAGGVARAVTMLLADRGAARIILLNRTVEKAQKIADEVNACFGVDKVGALPLEGYRTLPEGESYLCIQATNVGMFPDTQKAVIEDADFYARIHTGYDLIFNPARTRFMELVEGAGGRAYNGLKMLLYQGIIAYELWTGLSVSGELTQEAYKEMKKAMNIQ